MITARGWYRVFVGLVLLVVVLAAVPIVASDLFRQPYSEVWPTLNRLIARLRIDYNPTGGGAPPRFPFWREPADALLYYQDVRLTAADGVQLAAWYVPGAAPNGPSVILCHGLWDSKWWMLSLIPWLHEAGYHVITFDFRGHGGSAPRPATLGPEEVLDVQAALDWLDEKGVGERVGGLGMSMGAAALVNTAVRDDRLDALVLDSLFAEWQNVDYAEDYRLPPDWLVPGVPDPVELLPQIEVPVLIVHGTADILVHVDHAYRLYEAANEPKQLWINDSGHAWSTWTYPETFKELVLGFFGQALEPGDVVLDVQ